MAKTEQYREQLIDKLRQMFMMDQVKQMQTNNTALQISIRETELEAARLQGEYDVLNAAHPYRGAANKTRQQAISIC